MISRLFAGPGIYALCLSYLITPIIYGRYTEIMKSECFVSYTHVLKKHWVNYISVGLLLFIFTFAINSALDAMISANISYLFKQIVNAIICCLTLYVLPIVFVKEENLTAIQNGVLYLLHNLNISIPLLLITIIVSTSGLFIRIFLSLFHPSRTITMSTMLLASFGSALLDHIVFVTASLFLIYKMQNTIELSEINENSQEE